MRWGSYPSLRWETAHHNKRMARLAWIVYAYICTFKRWNVLCETRLRSAPDALAKRCVFSNHQKRRLHYNASWIREKAWLFLFGMKAPESVAVRLAARKQLLHGIVKIDESILCFLFSKPSATSLGNWYFWCLRSMSQRAIQSFENLWHVYAPFGQYEPQFCSLAVLAQR